MRVGQRLMLAVVPAILGLFTVAGLAYWGHLYRAAPGWVVATAAVAAVLSLVLAWRNVRYVARRIERLAGGERAGATTASPLAVVREAAQPGARSTSPDEIDSIEEVVDRLSGAVTVAEADSRERDAAASRRVQEYATLLAEATSALSRQLNEVRLPIHILLENHFGQLNDNQEEMLAAARAATEAADVELRRLREIAELDRGALSLRRAWVRVGDLLKALRPQLEAEARRVGARVTLDLAPGLPRVGGDRIRLEQAFELLLMHLIRRCLADAHVTVNVTADAGRVVVAVSGAPEPALDADIALASRIVLAHGGALEQQGDQTVVTLPVVGLPVAPTRESAPPVRVNPPDR